ncbi:hypothetical protein [Roseibacillus persicicus]|uniref:DoxX family protein n=1 Tax=Roseibacillus persicicus TaxID=454148 RepID=A0A918WID5_9BACT|nr:hypothetical protein [Roseibacillus persicicus]MDQ8189751.1 hypothetical protein [Roseibacillus persicicus]GHC50335.1 hypothetical protein GCM10007100_15530 [Roseibacillus persicicus]
MKYASHIAAGLLGLGFIVFGLNHFLNFIPMGDPPAEGSPPALFFGAIYATGFLSFVKILELLGGILVAIPKTRNIGLLILGPIIVNILAYNIFIAGGGAVFAPPVVLFSALAAFVLWTKRESWLTLIKN